MTDRSEELARGLSLTLDETAFDQPSPGAPNGFGRKQVGKVRDSYTRGGHRILVATDRISAFDRVLGTLPFKGQILNQLSAWWFQETAAAVPNHLVGVPDPCVTVARECAPYPVEFVVRSYLTGVTDTSIWTAYSRGERRFCGHRLPEGLKQHERLPEPLLTPSTKAVAGHDESVAKETLFERGAITPEEFENAEQLVLRLFSAGQAHCAKQGLILVDSKYEVGRDANGTVRVIDEVHTPDSSRYWFDGSYHKRLAAGEAPESFDKEYVRRWLKDQGYAGEGTPPTLPDNVRVEASRRYLEACEAITGAPFPLNFDEPVARIQKNLEAELERQVSNPTATAPSKDGGIQEKGRTI